MDSSRPRRRQVPQGQRGLAIVVALGLLLFLAIGVCLAILYDPGKKHSKEEKAPSIERQASALKLGHRLTQLEVC